MKGKSGILREEFGGEISWEGENNKEYTRERERERKNIREKLEAFINSLMPFPYNSGLIYSLSISNRLSYKTIKEKTKCNHLRYRTTKGKNKRENILIEYRNIIT